MAGFPPQFIDQMKQGELQVRQVTYSHHSISEQHIQQPTFDYQEV